MNEITIAIVGDLSHHYLIAKENMRLLSKLIYSLQILSVYCRTLKGALRRSVPILRLRLKLWRRSWHWEWIWSCWPTITSWIMDDGTCEPKVVPFIQSKGGRSISLYKGAERERFMKRFQEWSAALADPARLKKEWEKEISMRKAQYLASLVAPNTFSLRVARRLGILHWFKPRKRTRLLLENYVRCEAHREMMIDILSKDHG